MPIASRKKCPSSRGAPSSRFSGSPPEILEHQYCPTAIALKRQWPRRPSAVQLVLQAVFVSQVIEGGRCRMLGGGQHGQHGDPLTVNVLHASAEDTVAVLPQDLEAAVSVSAEPRRLVQLPYSAYKLANA